MLESTATTKSTDEIAITPKMIEAGVDALFATDLDCPTDREQRDMVARVFTAMSRARHVSAPIANPPVH